MTASGHRQRHVSAAYHTAAADSPHDLAPQITRHTSANQALRRTSGYVCLRGAVQLLNHSEL